MNHLHDSTVHRRTNMTMPIGSVSSALDDGLFVVKLGGYDLVETNASDIRSKKLLETGLLGVLGTMSLQAYFPGEGKEVETEKKSLVLIMDQVDGMSAGDSTSSNPRPWIIPNVIMCQRLQLPARLPK